MAEGEQNKTEQPTPHRLQEARNKGQVARSPELSGLLITAAFTLTLCATLPTLAGAWAGWFRWMIQMSANAPAPSVGLLHWLGESARPVWQAMTPLLFSLLVAAVAANLVQTGPIFSTEPLRLDFSRMNPVQGLKKFISLRTLWDLLKLALKVGLLSALGWWLARSMQRNVLSTIWAAPLRVGELFRSVYIQVTVWVLGVLALIAATDLLFARRELLRKLRMSRTDIKDEMKRRDGDPEVKQKRKRLMAELLKQARSIRRVPDADVLLTNPTHLAVALRYRPRTMRSPVVIAKGADEVAARMRAKATTSGVPCLRSPALARALFRECGVDHPVPDQLHAQLAPVYRWIMARPGTRVFS